MDIKGLTISEDDVKRVIAEAMPVEAAGVGDTACEVYNKGRTSILVGMSILNFIHPPSAGAIAAAVAILDKLCTQTSS